MGDHPSQPEPQERARVISMCSLFSSCFGRSGVATIHTRQTNLPSTDATSGGSAQTHQSDDPLSCRPTQSPTIDSRGIATSIVPNSSSNSADLPEEPPKPDLAKRIYELKSKAKWVENSGRNWSSKPCETMNSWQLSHEQLARQIVLSCRPEVLCERKEVKLDLILLDLELGEISLSSVYVGVVEVVDMKLDDTTMSKATDLAELISDSKDHVLFRMVPIRDSEGHETYVNGGETFKEVMSYVIFRCFERALMMAHEAIVKNEDESIRQVARDHLEVRELQKAIAVLEEEHLWAESGKSTRKKPPVRNNLQRRRDGYGILEEASGTGSGEE